MSKSPTARSPGDPDGSIASLRQQLDKDPDNQYIRKRLVAAYEAAGHGEAARKEKALYQKIEAETLAQLTLSGDPKPASDGKKGARKGEPAKGTGAGKKGFRRFADDSSAASAMAELDEAYRELRVDPKYLVQLDLELSRLGGRPTPLGHAASLSEHLGGAKIFLKREYQAGSEAHLTIATVGQAHVARCLGRSRMVAGLTNVQWGLQLASVSARFGLHCDIFLEHGAYTRQSTAVFQMRLMGANVKAVNAVDYRASDVREAGLGAWLQRPRECFLFMGLDSGPAPYQAMASDHTAVIGRECRRQIASQGHSFPDVVVVRGGDNTDAIGLFPAFLGDKRVQLVSVEPEPVKDDPDADSDPFHPVPGRGEEKRMQAVLEGREYVSVSREIRQLLATGRIDQKKTPAVAALKALREIARHEGLVPGLRTAHALAWMVGVAPKMSPQQAMVLLVKERGEQDLWDVMRLDERLS